MVLAWPKEVRGEDVEGSGEKRRHEREGEVLAAEIMVWVGVWMGRCMCGGRGTERPNGTRWV